ncbi:MAG: primosomal protein N' [Chloroflexi bacterium]|nr:primosomal protein N' [Chloroflexota bacterium]
MSNLTARVNLAPLDTPYAEIAVDVLNVPADKTYHYAIPDHLRDRIAPGVMVLVGFGERIIEGLVVSGAATSPVEDVREIMDVVADSSLLTPAQIALARKIARYYLASPMKVIGPMLPPGLRGRVKRWSRLDPLVALPEDVATTRNERLFLETLQNEGEVEHERLTHVAGPSVFTRMQRRLEKLGAVHLRSALQPLKPPSLRDLWVESLSSTREAEPLLRRSRSQKKLLRALESHGQGVLVRTLLEETGTGVASLRALEERGLVSFREAYEVQAREVQSHDLPGLESPEQEHAWAAISEFMSSSLPADNTHTMVVMEGTASGVDSTPWALHLHAAARALGSGTQVLLLAPNSFAMQRIVQKLNPIFPDRVLSWHGPLGAARRRTAWERVQRGESVMVVGTRSAVFLPFQNLGLILVDSEHDDSYKNQESPRFHAVTVAGWLAETHRAPMLLFSHTPRVTTYAEVEGGRALFARAAAVTPTARIIDMRAARHVGPRQLISRELRDAIASSLEKHRPVVLLQNRRGAATHALCPKCGHVIECQHCSVPLVQHRASGVMRCHHCGDESPIPTHCPQCETQLRFRGVGSQSVELEAQRIFPAARVARWDRDVINAKEEERPFTALREGKLDILVGTAAVLFEPLPVGLYAVVSADTALHLPDFRASERTYQLLRRIGFLAETAQAEMLIQTYTPASLPLRALEIGRYLWFYRKSIAERTGAFPPSLEMAVLQYQDRNLARAAESAIALVQCLEKTIARDRLAVELLGPAPAFPERVRGLYRWHVMVRGQGIHDLLVHVPPGWMIDVDPVSVL